MLALEMGTHPHLMVIHGEMDHAAAKLKEQFLGVAVALVLLNRIGHGLLGEFVLQLKGGHGQAVDENGQVERQQGFVAAVAELAGDAEDIGREPFRRLDIAGAGGAVKEIDSGWAVLDAAAQHLDNTPLGDLALQAVQELGSFRPFLVNIQLGKGFQLGGGKEVEQLDQVNGVFAVVVLRVALHIPSVGHQGGDDQGLQPLFAGVGWLHRSYFLSGCIPYPNP